MLTQLALLLMLSLTLCQQFTSGIAQLSPSYPYSTNFPSYTLNYPASTNHLILSISSFTIQTNTSCIITARSSQQANFTCTDNIDSISYLYFERTPLTYAQIYTYYFFEGNSNYSALWNAPLNLTIAKNQQLRAFLSGFVLKDLTKNTMISFDTLDDNSGINISRSLNVRSVNFSFILIQNYSPYNITFNQQQLSSSSRLVLKRQTSQNYLNFWGIKTLKYKASTSTDSFVRPGIDPALATDSSILSINNFTLSSNLAITAEFIATNSYFNTLNCLESYYSPLLSQCVIYCPSAYFSWNTSQAIYKYCVNTSDISGWLSNNYTNNNLADATNYLPVGCLHSFTSNDLAVGCKVCQTGWEMVSGSCMCPYGSYLRMGVCYQCTGIQCELNAKQQWTIIQNELSTVSIKLSLQLPKNQNYTQRAANIYEVNLTINKANITVNATYDNTTNFITFQIPKLNKADSYDIIIGQAQPSDDALFLIDRPDKSFLWSVQATKSIQLPRSSSTQIIQNVAPVFTSTDKSVPLILLIVFFLGDKINALSIFQTVSLIYLINFIPLSEYYAEMKTVIKNIFIFQPQPIVKITGNQGAFVTVPSIDINEISYDPLIMEYTQGQLFISLSFNNLVTLAAQSIAIVGLIKIIKKMLAPSSNQVGPAHEQRLNLGRSSLTKTGKIKWISQPLIKQSASFRQKLCLYFCILDSKKWIALTSLLTMQLLSVTFFILYQLTLPLTSFWHILSRLLCYLTLLLILTFPLAMYHYEPLHLLKCTTLIYKRRTYSKQSLWFFFFLNYIENLVYPVIVLSTIEAKIQLAGIILVQIVKGIAMRGVIKRIQMGRLVALVLFFGSLLAGQYLAGSGHEITMMAVMASSLLTIVSVQILKLIRSVIVVILSIFKEKPQEPKTTCPKKVPQNIDQLQHPQQTLKREPPTFIIPQQISISTLPINNNQPLTQVTNTLSDHPPYKSRAFRRRALKQSDNI